MATSQNVATCEGPFDYVPLSIADGTSYVVPHSGILTSWSAFAAPGDGQQLTMKLVRPFESGYLVRSHDGPRPLVPGQLNTFRTAIPVTEGEVLSLTPRPTVPGVGASCAIDTGLAADNNQFSALPTDTPDGQVWTVDGFDEGFRLNVSATILPPPKVTAISPTKGSVTGGTTVTITGSDFSEVQGVTFSGTPARSFRVNSEGQIIAVSPANAEITSRTVEVTTIAGRGDAPQSFESTGCFVPNLKKATLREAKKELRSGGCRLGKVKRLRKASLRTGKVVRQSPRPGKILAPGAKVSVTLKGGGRR